MRSVAAGELVRWGHPVDPKPQTLVLFGDGSQLVASAAWAGRAPIELANNEWVLKSDAIDAFRLPRSLVRGLVFAESAHPAERRQLAERVRAASGTSDEIWLTNQDRLTGRVSGFGEGTMTLSTPGGDAKLPLSRVEAVAFAGSRAPAGAKLAVGLRDGSLLRVASMRASEKELELALTSGERLTGSSVGDVVAVQALGSDRFVYLSDLEPAEYRHVPYLSIGWPLARDRNVLGQSLRVRGNRYLKGLGMHSAARVTYRLDGRWRRFEADVAIDDSAGRRGSVTFGVHVSRNGQWQAAFASGIERGGGEPKPVSVDVRGADGITLTVDYADRGDELDHADWLDARLAK
jgi:hypothetical protein